MTKFRALVVFSVGLFGLLAYAAVPSTKLYPFPGYDLEILRKKINAESIPNSKELTEAWRLYSKFRGAWAPETKKAEAQSLAQLDDLKATLEALPKPPWFSDIANPPQSTESQFADKIGDEVFEKQKATPEYQAMKALAIVYLTEHELDRPGAAEKALRYFTVLSITHPWDWQIHGLYSRLLVDARQPEGAWATAKVCLFLTPDPNLDDLKSFAFIGSVAAKSQWGEIQEAMKQAITDDRVAELAIVETERLFSAETKLVETPPKKQ
jgi:hypothetical protein